MPLDERVRASCQALLDSDSLRGPQIEDSNAKAILRILLKADGKPLDTGALLNKLRDARPRSSDYRRRLKTDDSDPKEEAARTAVRSEVSRLREAIKKYFSEKRDHIEFIVTRSPHQLKAADRQPRADLFLDEYAILARDDFDVVRIGNRSHLSLQEIFVEPLAAVAGAKERTLALTAIRDAGNRHIAVLGSAGSGKSSVVRRFLWEILDRDSGLPVFVGLKEYARYIEQQGALPGALRTYLLKLVNEGIKHNFADDHLLVELLERPESVVVFDGFDEIGQRLRERVRADIQRFMKTFPNTQVIVTGRSEPDVADSSGKIRALWLEDFDESQIDYFLHKWFSSPRLSEAVSRRERIERAIEASSALLKLAKSPLHLAIISQAGSARDIPATRLEVYDGLIADFLETLQRDTSIPPDICSKCAREVLEVAAFNLRTKKEWMKDEELLEECRRVLPKRYALHAQALKDQLVGRNGVLIDSGTDGMCTFAHETLLEYFCASYIVTNRFDIFSRLDAIVRDEGWHNILAMSCELSEVRGQGITAQVIRKLRRWRLSSKSAPYLALAIRCFGEVSNPSNEVKREARRLLNTFRWPRIYFDGGASNAMSSQIIPALKAADAVWPWDGAWERANSPESGDQRADRRGPFSYFLNLFLWTLVHYTPLADFFFPEADWITDSVPMWLKTKEPYWDEDFFTFLTCIARGNERCRVELMSVFADGIGDRRIALKVLARAWARDEETRALLFRRAADEDQVALEEIARNYRADPRTFELLTKYKELRLLGQYLRWYEKTFDYLREIGAVTWIAIWMPWRPEIRGLLTELVKKEPNDQYRLDATIQLARLFRDEDAFGLLEERVRDASLSREVRTEAARAIAEYYPDDERARTLFQELAVKEPDGCLRSDMLNRLEELHEDAELVKFMVGLAETDPDPAARTYAWRRLSMRFPNNAEVFGMLMRRAKAETKESEVGRREADVLMGQWHRGGRRAVDMLCQLALDDSDPAIAKAALRSMQGLGWVYWKVRLKRSYARLTGRAKIRS
jgi:NACHT domain